jgi:hypothetical protein
VGPINLAAAAIRHHARNPARSSAPREYAE